MRVAVVGAGIAGLGAAWLLSSSRQVTLFEGEPRAGGHTRTIDVRLDGSEAPVDTGFLVFNERTYPELCELFGRLGVDSVGSDMSFALSVRNPDLEWAGTNLRTLFAQPRNLARPAFLGMLADIVRFNREATAVAAGEGGHGSLGDFLATGRYGAAIGEWYLKPMTAAIWSMPPDRTLDFPFATFARFFHNHGLLELADRPVWRTVKGGGRTYVRKMLDRLGDVRTGDPVVRVERSAAGPVVVTAAGHRTRFDDVVLACHSDQALSLLADPSDTESRVLGAIRYLPNDVVVHTDSSLMPRRRAVWSAWNVLAGTPGTDGVCVTYWLNRLQPLPFSTQVFATLNSPREPAPGTVLDRCSMAHPQFDVAAVAAQKRLHEIQGARRTWYCGAWTRYGFHEDGLRSAVEVSRALGAQAPWTARAA